MIATIQLGGGMDARVAEEDSVARADLTMLRCKHIEQTNLCKLTYSPKK